MLKIKLLTEQTTLNNFDYVETKEYVAGTPLSVKIQINDSETDKRLIPDAQAKLIATIQNKDGTETSISGTMMFNPDDRSMWKIDMTSEHTNNLVGSNILIKLDFNGTSTQDDLSDSTDLRVGMAYSVLSKITFDGDC